MRPVPNLPGKASAGKEKCNLCEVLTREEPIHQVQGRPEQVER